MTLFDSLPRYGEAFLRLLYPMTCALCQILLELDERGLCAGCVVELQKKRFRPSEERIRIPLAHGEEAWAVFRYDGPVKEIFHQIKFERRRDLLPLFFPETAQFFARRPRLAAYDTLLPVPSDPRRRMDREFNQSGLIAEAIAKMIPSSSEARPRLKKHALIKTRSTPPQSLLGQEARAINLEQVFSVPSPRKWAGKSVLLVDDIFTTGATLEEAAKTLKRAGVKRIGYFALTRAVLN